MAGVHPRFSERFLGLIVNGLCEEFTGKGTANFRFLINLVSL